MSYFPNTNITTLKDFNQTFPFQFKPQTRDAAHLRRRLLRWLFIDYPQIIFLALSLLTLGKHFVICQQNSIEFSGKFDSSVFLINHNFVYFFRALKEMENISM